MYILVAISESGTREMLTFEMNKVCFILKTNMPVKVVYM